MFFIQFSSVSIDCLIDQDRTFKSTQIADLKKVKVMMKTFVILSCLALAAASPQAGYSYSQPRQYQQQSDYQHQIQAVAPQQQDSYTLDVTPRKGPKPVYGVQTQVHKHVYVHVAPPEDDEVVPRREVPVAPAQKHYKIIFIKAPSYAQRAPQQFQLPAANEEKTLVYVLSKKPEDAPAPQIIAQEEVKPSKPEVYFIKYKAQKETAAVTAPAPEYGVPNNDAPAPVPHSRYGVPHRH
jgi:hypothetical protein